MMKFVALLGLVGATFGVKLDVSQINAAGQLSPEQEAELQAAWDLFNTDGDDFISLEELSAVM